MKYFTIGWLIILLLGCKDKSKPAAAAPFKLDSSNVPKAAANPFAPIDISPMDISYYPADLPIKKMKDSALVPDMRIIYSRPHRQDRKIFGELVKYGEPWRLGANEATEIEFFNPVTIQGKSIPRGRYILYCIPQVNNWTIVFNNNTFSWGLKFNPQQDVYRFQIPVQNSNPTIEYLTIVFEETTNGATLTMAWENIIARLPIMVNR
ncbi:MAG: DUF2911 domain-containing protein [Flavisolibacter sp.]|nr:DUF2911 domain-containing protein [Flavisolibacter sp.]MBD0366283.1 DUF2911 domain-containing protein [Flavisolibacter sp.]